jgi:hypothetical protein
LDPDGEMKGNQMPGIGHKDQDNNKQLSGRQSFGS